MQTNENVRRLLLTAAVVSALAAVTAKAQYTDTFDNNNSLISFGSSFPSWQTYGFDNPGSPAVPNFRIDNAAGATWTIGWTSSEDNTPAIPGSGSAGVTIAGVNATSSVQQPTLTLDLFNTGINVSDISFDIRIDPSSSVTTWGGYGDLQFVTRTTDSYNWNTIQDNGQWNPPSDGWGFAYTVGTWQHIDLALNPATTGNLLRGLTISDYFGTDTAYNGNLTFDIDNLVVTPVPEPSSIALAGLGLAGLIFVRRCRTAKS